MNVEAPYLSPEQVRRLYDRVGRWQDTQALYERRPTDELIAAARLDEARAVLEFGCGTGSLAARLLAHHLPEQARYVGLDVSPVMVRLASERLTLFAPRAEAHRSDGSMRLPISTGSVDRVLATYVLDLLSPEDARELLGEADRVLADGGLLCLASLSAEATGFSLLLIRTWDRVWRHRPRLVGGCRPIHVTRYLSGREWAVLHRRVVTSWGVPSEVVVARPAR